MRVLVSTTAGSGHLGPLVPFARALAVAGHDLVVAAPASFATAVERAGFVHRPFADASEDDLKAVFGRLPGLSNFDANALVVGGVFGRIGAGAALPGMQALVEQWRPDLVVREAAEFASYAVADASGIPHVQVGIGLDSFERMFLPSLVDPLTALGAPSGIAGLRSSPRLSLLPAAFEGAAALEQDGTRRFRDDAITIGADAVGDLPEWWPGSSDPLVYVTFGTVAAGIGLFPSLYQGVVAAVADLPVRVLLTIGDAGDPELLGPLPANVHVERWWPQSDVMPHAAAMVGHGGFGTTLAGLAAGVPMVVVPLFADQPYNAARVEAIGAGIVLEGGPAGIGGLAPALRRLLAEDWYRAGARRVAEQIARLPPASDAVPFLEDFAKRARQGH
jgi:UDP:flavonoid glycosyltransferase YjiC (YdhE family)